MYSVTQRIKMIQQPRGGYIPLSIFDEIQFWDDKEISEVSSGVKAIQGMAVDYLTRFLLGQAKEAAFGISLLGAQIVSSAAEATKLLQNIKGIDDYSGSYTANYEDFSDTEYLFGGTSIKREAGKDLSIDCALEVTDGTAKVFWISGADEEVTLLETTGTYSDTITLPEGGNYIGIECENFTGSIELNME